MIISSNIRGFVRGKLYCSSNNKFYLFTGKASPVEGINHFSLQFLKLPSNNEYVWYDTYLIQFTELK